MTKRIAAACTLTMTLMLAACGAEDRPSAGTDYVVVRTIHVDGHAMQCAIYRPPSGGGLDCDWEGSR